MKLIELKSVGSGFDVGKRMIYPQNADGSFDTPDGVDLDDASEEWYDSLSLGDHSRIIRALEERVGETGELPIGDLAGIEITCAQFLLLTEALRSYMDLGLFYEDYDKRAMAKALLRTLEGKQKAVVK